MYAAARSADMTSMACGTDCPASGGRKMTTAPAINIAIRNRVINTPSITLSRARRQRAAIRLDPGGARRISQEELARVVPEREILVGQLRVRPQHVGELTRGAGGPLLRQ